MCNNSRRSEIIAMVPDCNAHGPVPSWKEPMGADVQQFFDSLTELYVNANAEWLLFMDTTHVELDYIATRAREAQLAMEAGSAGGVEDKAAAAAEEEEVTRWAAASGEVSSANTGAPLVEDVADESSSEEDVAAGSTPTRGRGRVPRRAGSGEPVRPGRAARSQLTLEGSGRHTRATAGKRLTKAAEKKKTTAPSSSGRAQTPLSSPPPADVDSDVDAGVTFDLGPLSPKRKRKTAEEEEVDDE